MIKGLVVALVAAYLTHRYLRSRPVVMLGEGDHWLAICRNGGGV